MGRESKCGTRLEPIALSHDHKPDRPDEMSRLKAQGARVHPTIWQSGPPGQLSNCPYSRSPTLLQVYPAQASLWVLTGTAVQWCALGLLFLTCDFCRVWDKQGWNGLAVSRSIGDRALSPYVISKPEIISQRLGGKDKVVVVASDGVWDHGNLTF